MCWFFSWNKMSIPVDMSSCENWTWKSEMGNLGFIVSLWTLQSKALPHPYCISDDRNDFELSNYYNMDSLKSKENNWIKFLKYLASGVLVNNFMISRFGTYGPLFSFLKTIKMSRWNVQCFWKRITWSSLRALKIFFQISIQISLSKTMTNGFEKGSPGAGEFLKYSPRVHRQAAVDVGSVWTLSIITFIIKSKVELNFNCSEKMTNVT